jgi:glycosyltransferase involved in cell wall biosynthesis
MINISVIVLTFGEEKHIQRCISSLASVATRVIVVDSYSTDKTIEIAKLNNAEVVQRKWKNYADQFQWGLDQANVKFGWVMRMDADEYLEPDLQREIQETLPTLSEDVIGVYLKRKVFFQEQWIRHGGFYPHTLLRIWRAGIGRIEQRWMDEHIILPPNAKTITLKGHLVDDNLKGVTFWTDKHNRYASREMADILIQKYYPGYGDHALREMNADPQARWKRILKDDIYAKLPVGFRAALYFFYRYFLKLGFLDGRKGFIWHFLQGFWYRLLVDVKVMEVEAQAQSDPHKIKSILLNEYGIEI